VGDYIVCLLDILGQGEELDRWAALPKHGELTEPLRQALKKTLGRVLGTRDLFQTYFGEFQNRVVPEEEIAGLTPTQREQFERVREARLSVQQFSDTIVFYAPVTNNAGDVGGTVLFEMLTAAAMGVICGLAVASPIRGAITVGALAEITGGDFYGPALAEAHRLESKTAKYPRVVLSEEAQALINRTGGFSEDAVIEDLSRRYHAGLGKLVHVDSDGQSMVDFMGEVVQATSVNVAGFQSIVGDAYAFACSQREHWAGLPCDELSSRYDRLLTYMRSRLSLWGMSPVG
jgi:hypothetical protein